VVSLQEGVVALVVGVEVSRQEEEDIEEDLQETVEEVIRRIRRKMGSGSRCFRIRWDLENIRQQSGAYAD
jgi:hypothetical protein